MELEDRLRSLWEDIPASPPNALDRVALGVATRLRAAPPRAARSRRLRPRLLLPVAAVAAAAAVVATGSLGGGGARISPAAAAALNRAAITAAHQPALPPLLPGRFYHFRDVELGWVERAEAPGSYTSCASACPPAPADWVMKARVVSEYWIAADGAGRVVVSQGRPIFRSEAARRSFRRVYGLPAGRALGGHSHEAFGPGARGFGWGLSYGQLQKLPADPDRLARLVRRQAVPSSQASDPSSANPLPYEEFQVVGDIMRASPLRPRVRAAFYTILSRLPGVELVGRVRDPLGREGSRWRSRVVRGTSAPC